MSENDNKAVIAEPTPRTTLPLDSAARKRFPIFSGVVQYFAAALAGVAWISRMANEKHNPGQPMHWSRNKSNDHIDCAHRHYVDMAENDGYEAISIDPKTGKATNFWKVHNGRAVGPPQVYYAAWRAMAAAQEWAEKHEGAPLSPASKL